MLQENSLNCWEFKDCGRQPGGKRASELGVCPAAVATEYDGIHNGKNAGRVCWAVSGTLCGGEVQGSFANKLNTCIKCNFFQIIQRQETRLCSFNEILSSLQQNGDGTQPDRSENQPTILIVDDSLTIRRGLKKKLSQQHFHIMEAADGDEAVRYFNRHSVDAIIFDIEMPNKNGFDACEEIRSSKEGRRIPVLFISGKDTADYRRRAFDIGVFDFISKSTDNFLDEVTDTVKKYLRPNDRFKGFNALLVEDNTTVNYLISSLLYQLGVQVIEAENDAQALEIIDHAARNIDLVISRYQNKHIDGRVVSHYCRSHPKLRYVPVLFICTENDAQNSTDFFHAGAADFVTLPFSRSELNARLYNHLHSRLLMKRLASEIQKNEMILHSAKEGIFSVDVQGRVTHINQAAADMLGWHADEIVGKSFHKLAHHTDSHGRSIAVEECPISLSFSRGTAAEVTNDVFWRSNGACFPVRYTASPIIREEAIEGAVVTFSDITAKQQAEALREEVEHITRHDLKAPLNAIIGLPAMMKNDPNLNDEQLAYLEMIEISGYRMLNMINSSLTLYKIEQGLYTPNPVAVNMIEIIKTVCREISDRLEFKNIDIQCCTENNCAAMESQASFVVYGEELLCYTLMANLIINACDAAPSPSSIDISLQVKGEMAEIAIHNQGEVPEQIRDRFFDKFVTSGKQGGTGLGTYSAKIIAIAQGGEVSMESSPSSGTTIRVMLPCPPARPPLH